MFSLTSLKQLETVRASIRRRKNFHRFLTDEGGKHNHI
jgi:hypothetical protein